MTYRAVGGKCCGHVVGVRCASIIVLMTTNTRAIAELEIIIDVAGRAGHAHVRASERKPR